MKSMQSKTGSPLVRTEAELESRLTSALNIAFPNIPREDLIEQRHFTVRLGHGTYKIDSAAHWKKYGRADVLIFHRERPLAVIELKREDLTLTHDDYEQAQSYANQLTPRPPLVVVTNGKDTRVYDSSNGQQWSGGQDASAAVNKMLANSAKLAAADMRWAIEALMGRETNAWVPAVREETARLLIDITDQPGHSEHPFANNLLFPRKITSLVIESAVMGTAFTIIEGDAQSGKSSCLREISLKTESSDLLAVLMLRGSGPGLFQALANLFAAEFEWNLTSNDARNWLRRMSNCTEGPSLMLAIDDVEPGSQMATDLEELAGIRFGNRLVVVLTTYHANALLKNPNGRTLSAIGSRSKVFKTSPMSLDEFKLAQQILSDQRIVFQQGAEYADDYRSPWVLRTIYDDIVHNHQYQKTDLIAYLPPSPGMELIDAAQKSYESQYDLLRYYRVLARCALADTNSHSVELMFAKANGFVVRYDALSDEARGVVNELKHMGAVRIFRLSGWEDVVVPTVPAAYLLELSDAVCDELVLRAEQDPQDAGAWLGERLDATYLGDMIGAQAIRRMAAKERYFSFGIIQGLLSIEPYKEPIKNGLFTLAMPDNQQVNLKIEDGLAWISKHGDDAKSVLVNLEDQIPKVISKSTSWMILGQLAKLPSAEVGDDDQRIDAYILLSIGRCPFPLIRTNIEGLPYFEHNFGDQGDVLCLEKASIEVATQAMADLFSAPWLYADQWVDTAIATGSIHLLHRLFAALNTVILRRIPVQSDWANEALNQRVSPALKEAIRSLSS
ncbi:type I restriction enzyme HsdR N-terminal domain-containing protein [Escherichia coli]|nr:type I restriction enzyme HsdR N-terminal domain-containing protein [Escherichia coli]EES0967429.1 type I restriction enzyme HsdR N-terminal domain-containing protein [Escherichia coli]EEW0818093.1 type I restriction enzyme HsdR N-terminal domain-containing protein [Escherichia coli]EFI4368946.1 type I restriction enzyme HsdR N-terminal domain-containing protein [Escherichia coli]EFJ1843932.1 type I restriction enzyme HsdR N-terminal domain-containing protein [Escherichia coli]